MNQIDINDSYYAEDELHEECGVFGVYDFDGNDVSSTIYYGLFALQHRGQESCGIAVSDTEGPKGKVLSYKDMGLVNEVFNPEKLEKLNGNIGVGHVRYSTAGSSSRENAQPLVLNYVKGMVMRVKELHIQYLQPIITQYFIDNKSEIWLLFLIAHSKR